MIMHEEPRKVYYLFSPFLRIFHWTMVICISFLFITGLLITKPASGGVSMEPTFGNILLSLDLIRNIHFIAAFIFVAAFILRIYGFVINKGDRLFPRVWKAEFWQSTIEVSMHYMLLKSSHRPYLRNPLARMSYVGLYSMVFVEILTGFAMYLMVNPNGFGAKLFGWTIGIFGSEFMIHLIHHYVAWAIILFVIGHVYMAIRADFMEREGEISSMFSGVKILEHEPVDVGEIMDKESSNTFSDHKPVHAGEQARKM